MPKSDPADFCKRLPCSRLWLSRFQPLFQILVEPLGKALDDPDYEVRAEALAALKAIRATLEEKREWKTLLQQIKSSQQQEEEEEES